MSSFWVRFNSARELGGGEKRERVEGGGGKEAIVFFSFAHAAFPLAATVCSQVKPLLATSQSISS